MDFQIVETAHGGVKILNLRCRRVEPRPCLVIWVGLVLSAQEYGGVARGVHKPLPSATFISSVKGFEFIANDVPALSETCGNDAAYIVPGSPCQISFSGRFKLS